MWHDSQLQSVIDVTRTLFDVHSAQVPLYLYVSTVLFTVHCINPHPRVTFCKTTNKGVDGHLPPDFHNDIPFDVL